MINRPVSKVTAAVIIAIAVVLLASFLFPPFPRVRNTPYVQACNRLLQIDRKLLLYASEHTTFPDGSITNGSTDTLVAAEILSTNDTSFLREYGVVYHGFELDHVSEDLPVFELLYPKARPSQRFTIYRDGHGRWRSVEP